MLTNKARKMLRKVDAFAKEELKNFGPITKNNAKEYIVLEFLNELEETIIDWNQRDKTNYILKSELFDVHKFELIILFIGDIANHLPEIEFCNREMYELVDYMIDEFVKIYGKQENSKKFEYAITMYYNNLKKHVAKGLEYTQFVLGNPQAINTAKKLSIKFAKIDPRIDILLKICNDLQTIKATCSLEYLGQIALLEKLGFNKDFIIELDSKKPHNNDENITIPKTKENKTKKDEKIDSSIIKIKQKEVFVERKALLEQLKTYINPETFEAEDVLDENQIKEVLILVSKLYDEQTAKKIRHTIVINNQKYLSIKKETITDMLIPEERKSMYKNLYNYCFLYQGSEIQYRSIFIKYYNEINCLVEEYMKEENELLIPDYKEQIELIFLELDMYLPYMPADIFAGPSRT